MHLFATLNLILYSHRKLYKNYMLNHFILYYFWIDKFFKNKFKEKIKHPTSYRIFTMNILFYISILFIVPIILFLFYYFKFSISLVFVFLILILIIISLIINLFSIKWLSIKNQKKIEFFNSMDYNSWKKSEYYMIGKRNTLLHLILPFFMLIVIMLYFVMNSK
jgi:hypothetical protein